MQNSIGQLKNIGDDVAEELKVLCINSTSTPQESISRYLEDKNYSIVYTDCLDESHEIITHTKPDIVIAESREQEPVWDDFLSETARAHEDLPVIVIRTEDDHQDGRYPEHCAWDTVSHSDFSCTRADDVIDKAVLKSKNRRYEKLLNQKHGYLAELEESKHQLQDMIDKRDFELFEAKEMLMRMQKMESLAFLAAGFSHDLQNMNSVMLSAVSSLEYSLSKNEIELPKNIRTYIQLIKQANTTSTDMVVKLKGLFEEKQKAYFDFNLMDIVDHVIDICRCTFPNTIKVWGCSDTQQAYFHGDQVSIEQALLNLCINASHAMTIMRDDEYVGGAITICLSSAVITDINPEVKLKKMCRNYWKLSITDTGVGIDDMTLEKIFKPMFTTKKKGQGSGLGLLMIKHIIDSHDGGIDVKSEVGVGTTFSLYLPKTSSQQPSLFESNI